MRKNKFFIWLLVIAAMIGLTACQKVSCKVEFDTNDGSVVESVDVFKNGTITAPADPTKDGYVFGGWYLDAECTQEVQFETYKVQGNITLYAKWVANEYTVTFNLNGGTGTADAQKVKHGERVTLPTGLTKEGCKFKAWYKDSALTVPFVASAGVTSDLTLYAKWESLLTFDGTNSGNATYDSETGTYTFTTTLGLFGRFMIAYDGVLLSADPESDLIITGAFSSENQAAWDENVYCDVPDGADAGTPIDYTTFICSSSRSVNYTITYDPATNTLDIQAEFVPDVYEVSEEGLFFLIRDNNRLLSSYGDATLNDDGSYSTTIELSQWWRVYLWFDAAEIDVNGEAADIKGDYGTWAGRDNPKSLYFDLENDGPCAFISSYDGAVEYKITYYPATDSAKAYVIIDADPETDPYDPSQEDVVKTEFTVDAASDTALAVWTEAGTIFRDTETSSWGPLANGWRLITIVDADGKIVYSVLNIGNGFGSVGEEGAAYYAHPDYATNNPAYTATDAGWKLTLPENCFAITGHGEKALALILALTGDEYPDSDTAQVVVNKMDAISDSARIAYDAAAGTVKVSGVNYEEEESPIPATGLFFEYSYGAEGTDIAYADAEAIVDNGDGTYSFVVELAAWRYVRLYWNGEVLDTATNLTLESKGNIYIGEAPDPTDRLFTNSAGQFEFVFTPATDSANAKVVAGPYVPPTTELPKELTPAQVNVDAGGDAFALWTEAGTTFHTPAGWNNNGWRLFIVVDAEGRIAYMVVNAPNGYGGPSGTSYYANGYYTDYTTNPAIQILDGFGPWVQNDPLKASEQYNIVIPEGGFGISAHGTAVKTLLASLTDNADVATGDTDINKRGIISDEVRLSHKGGKLIIGAANEEPTAKEWLVSSDQYAVVFEEAGQTIDTLSKYRLYLIVDAQGRIAYLCDMPISGYGSAASVDYARHSVYADYTTNPAFTNLGTDKDQWGNVAYTVVVPEGGFVVEVYTGEAAGQTLVKLLTGLDYVECGINKSSVNVDDVRVAYDNGKLIITEAEAEEEPAAKEWLVSSDQYAVVFEEAGQTIDTLSKYRLYLIVDAQGRIAYLCDMPISGYGSAASVDYARHSVYADYTTNPSFTNLGTDKDQWGNVAYTVVVPEGGFVVEVYTGEAAGQTLVKLLTGLDYVECGINKSSVNVDDVRVAYDNGKLIITEAEAEEEPAAEEWLVSSDQYAVVFEEAGQTIDTLSKYRLYLIVDAQGRIAYLCDMPISGYGSAASVDYARHSVYADYTTNPSFTNLGTDKDQWGNVAYTVVVPEGGFVVEVYTGEAAGQTLVKLLTGLDYVECGINKSSVNVDDVRVAYDNGKLIITK